MRRFFVTLLAVGSFVGTALPPLQGDGIKPDAEVRSFTFRKFNDRGLRIWDLSGKEAVFVSDQIIRVIDMHLAINSSGDRGPTELRSSSARIYVEDNSASGDGFVYVEGTGFSLRGRDWRWLGEERRIEIRDGATVTFDDAIRRVLE